MGTIRPWPAADIKILSDIVKSGGSAQQAGEALNCSRTCCLKKAKALGLKFSARRGIWERPEALIGIQPARDAAYVARCLAANPCGFGTIPIREAA